MKHFTFILLFVIALSPFLFSQGTSTDHDIPDRYVAKLKIISSDDIKMGYIRSVKDSSLIISERSDPRNWKDLKIDVSLIDKIVFRRNGKPAAGEYSLYGLLIGTALGVGIGLAGIDSGKSGHSEDKVFQVIGIGQLMGITGGLIGMAIGTSSHGSRKISIPIHGKLSNYKKNKEILDKYTY